MDIDRRTTLALLGAGVLQANLVSAQHQAHALKAGAPTIIRREHVKPR